MRKYREKHNEYISSFGIELYEFLPEINFDGYKLRKTSEVATRLTILCLLIEVSFNRLSGNVAKSFFIKNNLIGLLTEKELELLTTVDVQFKISETWKIECVCVFFWYLGIIDNIPSPDDLFDISLVPYYPIASLSESPEIFINSNFKVRTEDEAFSFLDLYSRLDYICDMAKINDFNTTLNSAAVYERRYALTWLANAPITNWEDIKCNSIY